MPKKSVIFPPGKLNIPCENTRGWNCRHFSSTQRPGWNKRSWEKFNNKSPVVCIQDERVWSMIVATIYCLVSKSRECSKSKKTFNLGTTVPPKENKISR